MPTQRIEIDTYESTRYRVEYRRRPGCWKDPRPTVKADWDVNSFLSTQRINSRNSPWLRLIHFKPADFVILMLSSTVQRCWVYTAWCYALPQQLFNSFALHPGLYISSSLSLCTVFLGTATATTTAMDTPTSTPMSTPTSTRTSEPTDIPRPCLLFWS